MYKYKTLIKIFRQIKTFAFLHIDLPGWQDNYDKGNQITALRSKGFKLDTLTIKYYSGYIVIIKIIILDTLTIEYYRRYS